MLKRILLTALSIMFLATTASAVAIKVTNKNSKLFNEVDQSYDVKTSWWWYEEEAPEELEEDGKPIPEEAKPAKIKYKVSPAQNKQFQMMQKMIQIGEAQLAELQKINATLDYNFPRRAPKYTINKKTGEKCLSNSSADCYVPILIPEAQQVPAMANFLKNPNMKNAKIYLGWQAAHFNHVTDIGYGISFGYKQYGKEAYPTNTLNSIQTPMGTLSAYRYGVEFATIKAIQDKLSIYVFLGKTGWMEDQIGLHRISMMNQNILSHVKDFNFIHLNEHSRDRFVESLKKLTPDILSNYQKAKISVQPKLFKKFKIDISPTVVVVYDDKKGTKIWQKITNQYTTKTIVSNIYNFLVYNKVIKPENMNPDALMKLKTYSMQNGGKLDGEAAGVQVEPNDIEPMVADDQYLSKPKKQSKNKE